MERNNNTCKLIKRILFGFRNFRNQKREKGITYKVQYSPTYV